MSKIFELFGYPLNDKSMEAETSRRKASCPFMGEFCDGGGNRPQSNVNLHQHPALAEYFDEETPAVVPSGVCSLQLKPEEPPWIICLRRILFLGKTSGTNWQQRQYQNFAEHVLLNYLDLPIGTVVGVWPEVKLKYTEDLEDITKSFDYTFDYILMPVAKLRLGEVAINGAGYSLFHRPKTIRSQYSGIFLWRCV